MAAVVGSIPSPASFDFHGQIMGTVGCSIFLRILQRSLREKEAVATYQSSKILFKKEEVTPALRKIMDRVVFFAKKQRVTTPFLISLKTNKDGLKFSSFSGFEGGCFPLLVLPEDIEKLPEKRVDLLICRELAWISFKGSFKRTILSCLIDMIIILTIKFFFPTISFWSYLGLWFLIFIPSQKIRERVELYLEKRALGNNKLLA